MEHLGHLLIFLQVTHQATTQASGTDVLVSEPSSGVVKEGEKFKLHCRNNGKDTYTNWFKNDKPLPEIHSEVYESIANSSSGGAYQCDRFSNKWERSGTLDVVTIASDMILTLEVKPRAVLTDETIILNCLVSEQKRTGYILWYRKEELIQQTSQSQYIIAKAEITDESTYRCEHKIDYRKWVSQQVNVTVTDRDVAFQVDPPSVLEGDVLNLNCRYRNYYLWKDVGFYKGNKKIHSMSLYKLNALHSIRVNSSKDSGSYHCTVDDKISRSVHVYVHERLVRLDVKPQTARDGDTIVLHCVCKEFNVCGSGQYAFYRNNSLVISHSGNSKIYKIQRTTEKDSGFYHCTIRSDGEEYPSSPVPVTVIRIPVSNVQLHINPSHGTVREGSNLTLNCSVSAGSPPMVYAWYRGGMRIHKETSNSREGSYKIERFNESLVQGHYSCSVSNKVDGREFTLHSRVIEVKVEVQNHTTAIRASVLTLFLVAALIALVFVNLPKRKQGNSSRSPQLLGETLNRLSITWIWRPLTV